MIQKAFDMSCIQEKMNQNVNIHCFIIGWQRNPLSNNVCILIEQQFSVERDF